jgi:hypothetical protein
VVLDASEYDGPLHRSRQLLRGVNDCVRDDGIRVTERRVDDSGRALATVSALRGTGFDLGLQTRPGSFGPVLS